MPLPRNSGFNEQVFEVESGTSLPGRVVVEVEGESRGRAVPLGDQAAILRFRAEAVAQQIFFGRDRSLRLALVFGEIADKLLDKRNVFGSGFSDVEHELRL